MLKNGAKVINCRKDSMGQAASVETKGWLTFVDKDPV